MRSRRRVRRAREEAEERLRRSRFFGASWTRTDRVVPVVLPTSPVGPVGPTGPAGSTPQFRVEPNGVPGGDEVVLVPAWYDERPDLRSRTSNTTIYGPAAARAGDVYVRAGIAYVIGPDGFAYEIGGGAGALGMR